MADVEEKIKGFLKEIKANKKKLKVKISVVLKKLEDYLFETKPTFNDNHVKLILLGDTEHDQQGYFPPQTLLNLLCRLTSSLWNKRKRRQ